jgi:hypothetical protein
VPTLWPQDHVIAQGKKLYFDDLNLFEWAQSALPIIECKEAPDKMRLMLTHYRAVFRDAQTHGFEAAKWSNGVILLLLEKGKVTWNNTYKKAEERRLAFTTCSGPVREYNASPPPQQLPLFNQQSQGENPRYNNINNNRGNNGRLGGKNKSNKPCMFYNNSTCSQVGHHESNTTHWKHVCSECWDPAHVYKECPNK